MRRPIRLIKALRIDLYKRESLQMNMAPVGPPVVSGSWKDRLHNIVDYPTREVVQRFIAQIGRPACDEVAAELKLKGIDATVTSTDADHVVLSVAHGEEIDFLYQVRARAHIKPAFLSPDVAENEVSEEQKYYRAEIHLREGGQDYDIMGWSKEGVISDIIDQYHKHMHFLHLVR